MSSEPHGAAGEDAGTLRDQIANLQTEIANLQTELDNAKEREKTRRLIATVLLGTLIVVLVLTFAYLVWLSRNFGELTMDEMVSVIPMVGTTLLTPLVGLIGAVTGFYFGGQVTAQATQETHHATMKAIELGMHAGQPNAGRPNAGQTNAGQPDDPRR